ncbi:hypothetical protein XU18_3421 [Perkinsela sp. CCAP 1560/4]|nr:hypothetical protein XU18_3421 [Perkinsela sp. CCAP 1560/4]|eukprot:KNH05450.1 hypothetical protein XU18_3421 [Perkinsela sp. CCAP 1560/4]
MFLQPVLSWAFILSASDSETDGLELIPQHTVHPPFLSQYWRMVRGGYENENATSSSVSTSGGIGNWDFGASTVITNDRVSLNSGWFRNLNKLHSVFAEGWRVILRLHYAGMPEVPLIFTYSTMKGNYPFMWTEIEIVKDQRGSSTLQVKTGGLNVTQGTGSSPLPTAQQNGQESSVEVQFLYNRRMEKLIVSVGESGNECLRVNAELDDGYHFGLQSPPASAPIADDWRWYLQGFYFTSLPHFSFLNSRDGKGQFTETSHFSAHKSKKADSMHEFIRSREDREKQRYGHQGTEEREQESYMQRIAEAQRRRMEMQERARKEAEQRRATPDPYAADEDDDDDDNGDDDGTSQPMSAAERDRIRKRIFDREMDVTEADYDGEYDSGGRAGRSEAAGHRMRQLKHQVVSPNKAPSRPPVRRRSARDSSSEASGFQPVQTESSKVETTTEAAAATPPPTQSAPPPQAAPVPPPVQQPTSYAQSDDGRTAPPPNPPPPATPQYARPADGQYNPYAYPPNQQPFYDNRQPYYGNPYAPGDYPGAYRPNPQQAPPQPQQYYQQPPPQPNPYVNGFQQYAYRQPV